MKLHAISRLPVCALAAITFCSLPLPSEAFLGFKKKPEKKAPAADERQTQEAQAGALLAEARAAQTEGRTGKARDVYKKIVKQFPFTNAAAEASYANAVLTRQIGKLDDAFEALQKFIEQYRSSPRFNDALQQQ